MTDPSAPFLDDLPPLNGPAPLGARDAPPGRRNARAVLAALRELVPSALDAGDGPATLLEIGSGPGLHAAAFAHPLAPVRWLPTDHAVENHDSVRAWTEAIPVGRARPLAPRVLDAGVPGAWPVDDADSVRVIFSANVIHIAPWSVALGLFEGAGRVLPIGGLLLLYGPFRREGAFTGEGDAAFQEWLLSLDARYGVRDLDGEVIPAAAAHGLVFDHARPMPANNLMVVLRKI
jgi:hypothetical protein